MRRLAAILLFVPASLAAACTSGSGDGAPTTSTSVTSTPTTSGRTSTTSGAFAAYAPDAVAITYDPTLVPIGASATVTITPTASSTTVQLSVTGLQPNRGYGSHLHTSPCGPTGAAAGPHYQNQTDPAASASPPSTDPSYANRQNEVWLDFTTDGSGKASSTATQPWTFRNPPRSLIIHAATTKTKPGEAGTAGARAACLTLPA